MELPIKINNNYIIDGPTGQHPGIVLAQRLNPFINNSAEYFVHFESDVEDDWFEIDKFKGPADQDIIISHVNIEIRYINFIQFGSLLFKSKYASKYLQPYKTLPLIFVCPICMKYFQYVQTLCTHLTEKTCTFPGKVVYHKDLIKIYEVDGAKHKLFCQNLCLLAKMFVENKIICYDVKTFVFYFLVLVEDGKESFAGYFSKDKVSDISCNLACILILPPFQRKGYGKLLISLSYRLSVISGVYGSPEGPLSKMGLETYKSYWTWSLINFLLTCERSQIVAFDEITEKTGIVKDDIIIVFQSLSTLKFNILSQQISIYKPDLQLILKNLKRPSLLIDPRCLLLDS